jgi:energy-coupling factor transporter ATP-binding protein EcfA2
LCAQAKGDVVIERVDIKRLRGIQEGVLEQLTPLVILVGPNGSGKSTVLDALMIGASPYPGEAIGRVVLRKQGLRGSRWLLWKGSQRSVAEITIKTISGATRVSEVSIEPQKESLPPIRLRATQDVGATGALDSVVRFYSDLTTYSTDNHTLVLDDVLEVYLIDPNADFLATPLHSLYTRIVEEGKTQQATAIAAEIVSGYEGMQILTQGDAPLLYLSINGGAVPAAAAGDGVRLLLHMAFELTVNHGVILLEEPETHLHPGAIRLAAKAMVVASRQHTQIVLSTHSLELIDALLAESSDQDLGRLSLFRLQLEAGALNVSRLPGRDVAFARLQIEEDLR